MQRRQKTTTDRRTDPALCLDGIHKIGRLTAGEGNEMVDKICTKDFAYFSPFN